MSHHDGYAIHGGRPGRERLRVLARTLRSKTAILLDRLEMRDGMTCLDVGCGGGDVSVELARRVGPTGRVVGIDIDETTLELARTEAREAGIENVEFHALDIRTEDFGARFDLVYSRFLLSHLSDPAGVVTMLVAHLEPGGVLAVEDTDFSGSFTWPDSDAHDRFRELYLAVVGGRGGDPNLGKRLPVLLAHAGLVELEVNVAQPIDVHGEAKLLDPLTMEGIADTVVRDGLASRAEVDAVVRELYRFAEDPGTVAGLPRIVQAWGRRPRG